MKTADIVLLALGLAMDAFAVSLSVGTTAFLQVPRARFRIAFHFGLFQCLMPIIGWLGGRTIAPLIARIDHWIAFLLLTFVGVKMIHESGSSDKNYRFDPSRGLNLVLLSVATSIDALAVGFSLALIDVSIWRPAVLIGLITGALSFAALLMGRRIGLAFGKRVERIGGMVLILIGLRIVIEHLFH